MLISDSLGVDDNHLSATISIQCNAPRLRTRLSALHRARNIDRSSEKREARSLGDTQKNSFTAVLEHSLENPPRGYLAHGYSLQHTGTFRFFSPISLKLGMFCLARHATIGIAKLVLMQPCPSLHTDG